MSDHEQKPALLKQGFLKSHISLEFPKAKHLPEPGPPDAPSEARNVMETFLLLLQIQTASKILPYKSVLIFLTIHSVLPDKVYLFEESRAHDLKETAPSASPCRQ